MSNTQINRHSVATDTLWRPSHASFRLAAALLWALGTLTASCLAQNGPNQVSDPERKDGWRLLFDGQTLDGWTATGHADAWKVEDGSITCAPGGGGWLRTVNQYRDFEMLIDFRVSPGANSGLGLRASATDDPAFTGMELQIIDSAGEQPGLTNCGAVYDAIAPLVMAANPPGEWNTYHVRLIGDTLDAWLNGQAIHLGQKLDDRGFRHQPENAAPLRARVKSGYICMQDHGDAVTFRNIKIKPLKVHPLDAVPVAGEPQWVDLFNGHDLTGWFVKGNAAWSVEDGQIVGHGGGPGHLYSDGVYKDFELRAKVMINTKGNSGFYFRSNPPAANPDSWPDGYEAQVDHRDPKNFTGCLYDRAWADKLLTNENEWFDYSIRCVGNHITLAINGKTTLETDQDAFAEGHVALQGHHPESEVRWRDIQIRVLDSAGSPMGMRPGPLSDGIVDVFYCTHSAGFRHEVLDETRQIMERIDAENDWLRVVATDSIADLTPDRLAAADVVMFFTTGELPMTEEQKAAFVKFCERGGGFVGVHSATDTCYQWPWYGKLVGGYFNGHPWNENVGILVADGSHASTKHFGTSRFEIADEIYTFRDVAPDWHILLELDASTTHDATNGPYPLAWTRTTGKGRVFYTALGHRPEVWHDARFIEHLTGGIRWAAGVEN